MTVSHLSHLFKFHVLLAHFVDKNISIKLEFMYAGIFECEILKFIVKV